MDHHHAHGHIHSHSHDEAIPIDQWMQETKHLSEAEVNKIRMVPLWVEAKWETFPDAGSYQPTRLTSEISNGACSAIWLKLDPDEGFDPHRHPNAIHSMTVFEGEADLYWKDDGQVYSVTMEVGRPPYTVLPTMPHAIVANRGVRVVMLVMNTPPDDLSRDDYAQPVTD